MLKAINNELENLGINYEFAEWTSEVKYPYFVGEYTELENFTEDNVEDIDFILTGFTRGLYSDLEDIKNKIKKRFFNGVTVLYENKSVTIFYGNSLGGIPTGEFGLKKIQIFLKIKVCEVM